MAVTKAKDLAQKNHREKGFITSLWASPHREDLSLHMQVHFAGGSNSSAAALADCSYSISLTGFRNKLWYCVYRRQKEIKTYVWITKEDRTPLNRKMITIPHLVKAGCVSLYTYDQA